MRMLAFFGVASLLAAGPASAQDVTLTVHHFLGPNSPTHAEFIEPWARDVEEASGGRIKIEIFPSMALGGKPPDLYRQVRDGVADIVWTLPGYTPGVFPRSEVFELASVHRGSAQATNLAIQDVWSELEADYDGIHPILMHVHAGNALHMSDDKVQSLDDLAGVRLRTPSRTGAWMIEAWGAEPVGMPLPELPEALSRGLVDGALIPFEVMSALRLDELTDHSVEGPDARRFGTSVFLFAMNSDRYEALPDDLKAVIDAHSGANIAEEVGLIWDENEVEGIAKQEATGAEVIRLDATAMAPFDARALEVEKRWESAVEAEGIEGKALVDQARDAVARHSE